MVRRQDFRNSTIYDQVPLLSSMPCIYKQETYDSCCAAARGLTNAPAFLKINDMMTREELIKLGRKIIEAQGTEEEINAWCEQFDRNVPHPDGSGLFYWPENYNHRKDDISQYNPSVEEVVDKALSYQPLVTPPPQSGN